MNSLKGHRSINVHSMHYAHRASIVIFISMQEWEWVFLACKFGLNSSDVTVISFRKTCVDSNVLGRQALRILDDIVHLGVVVPNDLFETTWCLTWSIVHC